LSRWREQILVYKTKNIHLLFYPATLNQKEEIKKDEVNFGLSGGWRDTHTHWLQLDK
jgi:hypothetical protein